MCLAYSGMCIKIIGFYGIVTNYQFFSVILGFCGRGFIIVNLSCFLIMLGGK
jgi:hypothetical protein